MTSVDHLCIESEQSIMGCGYFFPNVTKLTIEAGAPLARPTIEFIFNRIFCLENIIKLIIEYKRLYFVKLMDFLLFLPNIHTLECKSTELYQKDTISVEESEIFRSISETNTITNATFEHMCTLEHVKLLVTLCPRLQNLTMDIYRNDMEGVIRYLLERTNPHTGRLASLCFLEANVVSFRHLNAIVESGRLPRRCMLKHVDSKLYLWW
jgi:hypothetical protein